jgi:hypothetical protein
MIDDDGDDNNDEYLICSISYDRRITISSLRQRVIVYEMDVKNYLEQICFHEPSNKIFLRTLDY